MPCRHYTWLTHVLFRLHALSTSSRSVATALWMLIDPIICSGVSIVDRRSSYPSKALIFQSLLALVFVTVVRASQARTPHPSSRASAGLYMPITCCNILFRRQPACVSLGCTSISRSGVKASSFLRPCAPSRLSNFSRWCSRVRSLIIQPFQSPHLISSLSRHLNVVHDPTCKSCPRPRPRRIPSIHIPVKLR